MKLCACQCGTAIPSDSPALYACGHKALRGRPLAVLQLLGERPGLTVLQIGAAVGADRYATQEALTKAIRHGFVARQRIQTGGRGVPYVYELSDRGRLVITVPPPVRAVKPRFRHAPVSLTEVAAMIGQKTVRASELAARRGVDPRTARAWLAHLEEMGHARRTGSTKRAAWALTPAGRAHLVATGASAPSVPVSAVVDFVEEEPSSTTKEVGAEFRIHVAEAEALLDQAERDGLLVSTVVRGSTVWNVRRAA